MKRSNTVSCLLSHLKADQAGGLGMKWSCFSLQPAEPVVMWTGALGDRENHTVWRHVQISSLYTSDKRAIPNNPQKEEKS